MNVEVMAAHVGDCMIEVLLVDCLHVGEYLLVLLRGEFIHFD